MGKNFMHLEFQGAREHIVDKTIIEILKTYQNVIVFGGGDSGEWAVNLLRRNDIFPKCYCDNSPRKWGKEKSGLKILPFETAIKKYSGAAICIASMWCEEICKQIGRYDKYLLDRTFDILSTMAWETTERHYKSEELIYIKENEEAFQRLYDEFGDDRSKLTLEGLLNYRLTRKKTCLKAIKSEQFTYLDREVISDECLDKIVNGIIIDGGAFDGDSVDFFIKNLPTANALNIHCYEAEAKNYEIIEKKIFSKEWEPHHIVLHKAALWDVQGKIGFAGNGLSGCTDENSDFKVAAENIDCYPYGTVGLIKLDVEGAERKALKGAIHTIQKYRPVLAICAYHLQDDMLVLSDFIKSLNCGYTLVLRHYMLSSGDTVLYGIPEK